MSSMAYAFLPAPMDGGFSLEDHWVWCGSVLRSEDGKYHMYASVWSQAYPFYCGYLLDSRIVRAVSDRPEGPYHYVEDAFEKRKGFFDASMMHNPTVQRWGDKWIMYYIGTRHKSEPMSHEWVNAHSSSEVIEALEATPQAIGLAVADKPEGPWRRFDEPVLSQREGHWDNNVVTNPAACVVKGRIHLVYRSFTPDGMRLGMAWADTPEGPYERFDEPLDLGHPPGYSVEDPYLWHDGSQFEIFMKDITGTVSGQMGAGIRAVSVDGQQWHQPEAATVYRRQVLWSDGVERLQGALERPQLLLDEKGRPSHLFAATGDGEGGFENFTRSWNMVLPFAGQR